MSFLTAHEMRFRTIIKNISLLNLVLAVTIAVFAAYTFPSLLNVQIKYSLPSPKDTEEEEFVEEADETQPPQILEYLVIAEQNIFHPERKIPVEKKEEKPLPKPEFVLYGTLIAGDTSLAFIDDMKASQTSPGRGKRQRTLRLGSSLSGFTLNEVLQDKVVMVRGEERIEVRVLDSSKSRAVETGGIAAKKPQEKATVTTPKQPAAAQSPVQSQGTTQEDLKKRRDALRGVAEKPKK